MFELVVTNLTSPIVLFFVLGLVITLIKAKVEFPGAISEFITIYLLTAIGFKGGVAISAVGVNSIFDTIGGAIGLGMLIPVIAFMVLWKLGKFSSDNAAAIAGHYGSVSVVTFMAGTSFLANSGIQYEGYINGLPAVMEVPGIVVALVLAAWIKQRHNGVNGQPEIELSQVIKKVCLSKSVVLLLGAMMVGLITGPRGMASVEVFYKDIFMGMLSLFMLEMGMIAAGKVKDLKKAGAFLVAFGVLMPPVGGLLGVLTGFATGLSLGGSTLLGILAASSSYIVAPAAMRVSLPKANPALYLGASLGITLPFNLVIGIPLYYFFANRLAGLF